MATNLDDLIGLQQLKEQFENFSNLMKYNNWRKKASDSNKDISINLHMAFLGNPGTGKTTVANRVGALLKEMNILEKGHVVVADRSTMVAGYIGQTANKVRELVTQALDGVLFIDEAYALYAGSENDFGHEALSTLISEMENNRGRLVVIFAGYKDKMDNLFKMNEGLNSRISYRFTFDDYTLEEKVEILKLSIQQNGYSIAPDALEAAKLLLTDISNLLDKSDENRYDFGNARGVRNFFEYMIQNIANRVGIITNGYTEKLPDDFSINEFTVDDLTGIRERFLTGVVINEPVQIGFK